MAHFQQSNLSREPEPMSSPAIMWISFNIFMFVFMIVNVACTNGDTCTACQSHSSYRRLSEVITVTSMFTIKIKWDVYTISAEEGKQVCDNMNKICELLMISILMTNHHDNQFILSPEIAHWCREIGIHEKCILKSEKCSENGAEIT